MTQQSQRSGSSATRYFAGQRPERVFRHGELARFNPPAGTYSRASEQHRQAGKPCLVVRMRNDSTVTVTFGDGNPIVVDSSYLYLEF